MPEEKSETEVEFEELERLVNEGHDPTDKPGCDSTWPKGCWQERS